MQRDPKGNRDNLLQQPIRISASLLQAVGRYQIAASKTFVFSRIFSILHAVSDTFWLFAKRGQTTFRSETKGNKVTSVSAPDPDP